MNTEIKRLAAFLLENFRDEIGKGDPRYGESAVDVAIRLLSLLKTDKKEKYYYCEDCKIAFNRKVGNRIRMGCPMCHSGRIVEMGGSFKEVKGVYFNPSER